MTSAFAADQILPLLQAGDQMTVLSDAVSTVWCWRKGSKLPHINDAISISLRRLHLHHVHVLAEHIPGELNLDADWLSRNIDAQNYRLDPRVFRLACRMFAYQPLIDLFASRGNKQVPKYCSWVKDPLSQGNAFRHKWTHMQAWCNPPWSLIPKVLKKIQTDQARLLVCLPVWRSATWWPMFRHLQLTRPLLLRRAPMYVSPKGLFLPAPRWATLCTILQG